MPTRPVTWFAALLASMAVAACSDGASTEPPETSTTRADAAVEDPVTVEPLAVGDLAPPAPGQARIVLGSSVDSVMTIERCVLDGAAEPADAVPAEQVVVVATGSLDDGTPVLLDVARFVTPGAAVTITDTATVTVGPTDRPTSVLQAQRFEVGGLVTDGRDPEATAPLLQIVGRTVEAVGRFAPPGNFVDDGGLVEGLVVATCPAPE